MRPERIETTHDFRLVPVAIIVWLGTLLALLSGWWWALVAGVGAGVLGAVLRARVTSARQVSCGAALLMASALLLVPISLRLHTAEHEPLRGPAAGGAEVLARIAVTARARPVRTEGYAAQPGRGRTVVLEAEVEEAAVDGAPVAGTPLVLVFADGDAWSEVVPGQVAVVRAGLAPVLGSGLAVATLRVRGPPLALTDPPWWQRAAAVIRAELRTAATRVLDPDEAGLLPGLVVGDTRGMTVQVEEDFLDAGMSHLTAVSGANVAIICGATLLLARAVRAGPRTAAAIAAAGLAGFVILVGYEPSVVRAGVMGAVGLLALYLGRRASALPALAFSVLALVTLDPALAASVGFALSVVATAGLVLVAPRWSAAMRERGVPVGFAEGFAVPLAAFAVTAPVIAGFAGEVSLVSVLANLLAAPVVAPATILGVLAACAVPFAPALAELLVRLAGPEAGWLVFVARQAAEVPGAVVDWPGGWGGGLLAAAAVGLLVLVARSRRGRVALVVVVAGALLVYVPVGVSTPGWPPERWTVVACDVGQGDSLLLATGDPGRAVMVDVGGDTGGADRCLRQLGVERLPLVLLSHLHADHIGGLSEVLAGRAVGGVAVGPGRRPDWAWRQVVALTRRHGVALLELTVGQRLRWRALELRVIGPRYVPGPAAASDDGTDVNNSSVVAMATTELGRVLLTGDVELAAQSDLLAAGEDLHADVLKVPHHGSRYVVPEFLASVRPRIAVISVGAGNRYGHPNRGVVDGLRYSGATVVRTDLHGDSALIADGDGPLIVRSRDPPPDGSPSGARERFSTR